MIDIKAESLLPFTAAAKLIPPLRKNRPVNPSTVWRWHHEGHEGIHLEAVRLPGGYFTSAEALQRFIERLTAAGNQRRARRKVAPT